MRYGSGSGCRERYWRRSWDTGGSSWRGWRGGNCRWIMRGRRGGASEGGGRSSGAAGRGVKGGGGGGGVGAGAGLEPAAVIPGDVYLAECALGRGGVERAAGEDDGSGVGRGEV